jgi:hypothetical protein
VRILAQVEKILKNINAYKEMIGYHMKEKRTKDKVYLSCQPL